MTCYCVTNTPKKTSQLWNIIQSYAIMKNYYLVFVDVFVKRRRTETYTVKCESQKFCASAFYTKHTCALQRNAHRMFYESTYKEEWEETHTITHHAKHMKLTRAEKKREMRNCACVCKRRNVTQDINTMSIALR